jgi:hypothetical protein
MVIHHIDVYAWVLSAFVFAHTHTDGRTDVYTWVLSAFMFCMCTYRRKDRCVYLGIISLYVFVCAHTARTGMHMNSNMCKMHKTQTIHIFTYLLDTNEYADADDAARYPFLVVLINNLSTSGALATACMSMST